MNWADALCSLFDRNAYRAGEYEDWINGQLILMPIGHSTVKAAIEIRLDAEGNFRDARALHKDDDLSTLAPVTEKSMSRTSTAVAPHPLFDSLIYLAGDFLDYTDHQLPEKKKKRIAECFSQYQANLKAWCGSPYSDPKVCAVYRYISKKSLLKDLINTSGLLEVNNGLVKTDQKVCGVPLEKAVVRFCVTTEGDTESRIWLDKEVQKSFIDYYASISDNNGLDYITGETTRITTLLPKKIRYDGDGAKLISSNDSNNFTYRGRFLTKDNDSGLNEAASVGYETSQKFHNALKWIIRRQGYIRNGVCVVTWESDLKDMPPYYCGGNEIDFLNGPNDENADTNYDFAKNFNKAIDGYKAKLNKNDISHMYILALDNASPGRLAMTYYKELSTSDYLENIRSWQESCSWRHEYLVGREKHVFSGIPSISEIAKAVYGTEQDFRGSRVLKLRENSEGKCPMLISAFERLRPCVLDGAPIPYDMVNMAVQKASNPVAYDDKKFNYPRVLHVACSLVKKYYWDKGAKYDMKLDETCSDRSYLYGRLLAVAERIERSAYDKGETRTTNAERYMRQFSHTPMRTWEMIRKNTQTYLNQLKPGSREYYKNLYGQICGLFTGGDYEKKGALDGRFLLGYDCQREALKWSGNDNMYTDPANSDSDDNDNK